MNNIDIRTIFFLPMSIKPPSTQLIMKWKFSIQNIQGQFKKKFGATQWRKKFMTRFRLVFEPRHRLAEAAAKIARDETSAAWEAKVAKISALHHAPVVEYKIKSHTCQLSSGGAVWEYYHFLIDFCPILYKYWKINGENSHVVVYIPKTQEEIFNLKTTYLNNIVGEGRTMEHHFNSIFGSKITFITVCGDPWVSTDTLLSELNIPSLPFKTYEERKTLPGWVGETLDTYTSFQKYLYKKFNVSPPSKSSYY